MMVDTTTHNKKWNITYYDYTAADMGVDDFSNYGNRVLIGYNICFTRLRFFRSSTLYFQF